MKRVERRQHAIVDEIHSDLCLVNQLDFLDLGFETFGHRDLQLSRDKLLCSSIQIREDNVGYEVPGKGVIFM